MIKLKIDDIKAVLFRRFEIFKTHLKLQEVKNSSENQNFGKSVLAPPSQTRAADPTYDFQNLFSAFLRLYENKLLVVTIAF